MENIFLKFAEITAEEKLTLDQLWILYYINHYEINKTCLPSVLFRNYKTLAADLVVKGYLHEEDKNYSVTKQGAKLLDSLESRDLASLAKPFTKEIHEDEFEKFWKTFPLADNHGRFERTRVIRVDKARAKKEFDKIILSGKYTSEQLIASVKYKIDMLINDSKMDNKLKYLSNPATYLKKGEHEAILELMKENPDITPKSNVTDL